jgi:signal transduction histidine kinase
VSNGPLAVVVSGEERDESEHPSNANEKRLLIYNGFRGVQRILELGAIEDSHVERAMVDARALLAYRMDYRSVSGTVLPGNRIRNDRLAGDQVHVLSIVVDQFAATLHNRREETRRQQAERKMLQQEKLSVLGLLSGSLAHEIRNPLSSIRTIVTLVMEDLGESNEASLSEIVFNLVKNAIEAAKGCPDGKVEIQTQCKEGNFLLSMGRD